MKERYRGIDLLRSAALLLVLFHHFYVLTGNVANTGVKIIDIIVAFGGEIGVTLFFCISGFGIYWSLKKQDTGYRQYLMRRAKRILPQYYVCLLIALMIGDGAYSLYIGNGAASILAHVFMIHNIYPPYAGDINGSLWTMGVIVQFYIFAPILYKWLKKYGVALAPIAIIVTVGCKIWLFQYVLPYINLDVYVWASRQLLVTALDNFVMGMVTAYLIDQISTKLKLDTWQKWCGIILGWIGIIIVCYYGIRWGMYSNSWWGYVGHSLLAVVICWLMFFMSVKQHKSNLFISGMLWLSRYEYGIYLWHLLFVRNFIAKAPVYPPLMNIRGGVWLVCAGLFIGSVLLGWLSTVTIDRVEWNRKIFR